MDQSHICIKLSFILNFEKNGQDHFCPAPRASVRQESWNLQFKLPLPQKCIILNLKRIGHVFFKKRLNKEWLRRPKKCFYIEVWFINDKSWTMILSTQHVDRNCTLLISWIIKTTNSKSINITWYSTLLMYHGIGLRVNFGVVYSYRKCFQFNILKQCAVVFLVWNIMFLVKYQKVFFFCCCFFDKTKIVVSF